MSIQWSYLCPECGKQLKTPGQMGRAWCSACELYPVPVRVDLSELEQNDQPSDTGVYQYTTWRPANHIYAADETPEHKFMFVKRRDLLQKGDRSLSYKAKCTCGKWKHNNSFTTRRAAHTQWEGHMAEVKKQETLFPANQAKQTKKERENAQ